MAIKYGKKAVFTAPQKGIRLQQPLLYRICNKGVVVKGRQIRAREPKD